MKRLLITLSAIGCLFADLDVTGNWKLSGLKVDYLHVARETTDVEVCAQVNPDLCVTVQTIPSGVMYNQFVNGPFTLPIIDAYQLNLNVNLWPDGTGYIAEGSFYPDIDLIPGTCITSPQIFPVTDEFVWELGEAGTFSEKNILGMDGQNDLAGAGSEVYGFGVSQSGTFDGWPSTPLPERVPAGMPYVALTDGTVLGYACDTALIAAACAEAGLDAQADPAGCEAALVGAGQIVGDGTGPLEQAIGQCLAADYATAVAAFGGAGYLHGSGSSGSIAGDQGNSQMGQELNVDLQLEWNAIDGVTSQSGIDIDDEDEDGDATEYNRIFGIPYISSTYVLDTPECDITGGTGLNHPLAGDVISELGGSDALGAFLTSGCIDGVGAQVAGQCGQVAAGAEALAVATCQSYQPVDSTGGDGLFVVLYAGCLGDCFDPTGQNDTCGPEAHGACAGAAGQGVAMYGSCEGWAPSYVNGLAGGAAGAFVSYFADLQLNGLAAEAGASLTDYVYGGCMQGTALTGGDELLAAGGFAQALCLGFGFSDSACGFDADDPATDENEQGLANLVTSNPAVTDCASLAANVDALTAAAGALVDTVDESGDNNCDEWAPTVADGFAALSGQFAYQTCEEWGANYISNCVVVDADTGGNTSPANSMYLLDPTLTTWGLFLTYNAATVQGYLGNGFTLEEVAAVAPELFVNDSDHDFDGTNGRLVMDFEPTCVPEIEARQIVAEFLSLDSLCEAGGDANSDGIVNVVDIVRIVAHILGSDTDGDGVPDLLGGYEGCQADLNADGIINVVDVVGLVQIVLGNKSDKVQNATEATVELANNTLSIESNGFVGGIELTVEYTGQLDLEFSDNCYVCDFAVDEDTNTAKIVYAGTNNVTDVFTVINGEITSILEETVIIANAEDSVHELTVVQPGNYTISNAYPNPFNPSTTISVELKANADLSVKVYNLMGQLVDVIAEGSYSPNTYNWTWNAENLASGVYLVKTQVGSDVSTQKVMLLK